MKGAVWEQQVSHPLRPKAKFLFLSISEQNYLGIFLRPVFTLKGLTFRQAGILTFVFADLELKKMYIFKKIRMWLF